MTPSEIAISTLCLMNRPLDEALETLCGHTDAVELMNDGKHYTSDAALLQSYPFRYSIHAPARSVNIASVLQPIRKASVELVCESMSLAAACNASSVVFHPGYYTFEEEYDKAVVSLKQSLAEIAAFSEDIGIPCCVENMGNWGFFFLKSPEDLPLVGDTEFCLDIGHAHECGTLSAYLSVPFTQIHVHDNDGTSDTHLALGAGTIDIPAVMAAIRKNRVRTAVAECGAFDDATATRNMLVEQLK